jgi:hypothetical protein
LFDLVWRVPRCPSVGTRLCFLLIVILLAFVAVTTVVAVLAVLLAQLY